MRLPKPIKYAAVEGGDWISWDGRKIHNRAPTGIVAHTIVFDNGRAFDMYNGWRDGKYDKKTGERRNHKCRSLP